MNKVACFFGVHSWEIIERGKIEYVHVDGSPSHVTGRYFVMQCRCCGRVRTTKL